MLVNANRALRSLKQFVMNKTGEHAGVPMSCINYTLTGNSLRGVVMFNIIDNVKLLGKLD